MGEAWTATRHDLAVEPVGQPALPVFEAETESAVGEKAAGLTAIASLFQELNRCAVRYCVWKSNVRLQQALRAETDLDLLVDRRHAAAFVALLGRHSIKLVKPAPGRDYPAIENYLGYDEESGKIFHLHVHYQLVLGERYVKSCRLPIEERFLDHVQWRNGVKIPSPELELIVLSFRVLLKYRVRDLLKDLLHIGTPGIPPVMRQEVSFLLGQTSWDRISAALDELSGVLPSSAVTDFLSKVLASQRAGYATWRLRARVWREMGAYRRHSRFGTAVQYIRGLMRENKYLSRLRRVRKKTLPRGGVTLALVGADGAGKTTLAQVLVRWLGPQVDIHRYYLGSKQPSTRSKCLYLAYRAVRRGARTVDRFVPEAFVVPRLASDLRDAVLCLHHLSVAYDRYRRFKAARSAAARGSIVIYDRFPLPSDGRQRESIVMDGPQIPLIAGNGNKAVRSALARWEQSVYYRFVPPDYLLLLEVSHRVSMERKPDHKPAAIEAKIQATGRIALGAGSTSQGCRLIRLNADLPLEQVIGELKKAVWQAV